MPEDLCKLCVLTLCTNFQKLSTKTNQGWGWPLYKLERKAELQNPKGQQFNRRDGLSLYAYLPLTTALKTKGENFYTLHFQGHGMFVLEGGRATPSSAQDLLLKLLGGPYTVPETEPDCV